MGENSHILVVDDDNRIRSLIKEYLGDNNFIVSTASNADEAKKKLSFFKFNLLVLDVMMPGQDGYSLVKELKEKICPPIILLTAKGEAENRVKGLELGADDYLSKPFEPKELLLRIKNIISKNKRVDPKQEYYIGKAIVNLNKMIINFKESQKKINIAEKKVLIEMLANPGKTYSRAKIGEISGIVKKGLLM